ncbi:receptor-type tyrosine-protein phosphatase N2 isoform X2 [Nasonia vitripennis]|uniref:Receptor-type tyrosine-protein phosphatase N2 n=1 Tax=Nasonia vitripennis TaxID=7425 RepID=A0A7M7IN55_NASVI|nr:receptor-type tyrosine-protein phosphatase N2 isoform X2 [Nasonia vitripennis]
MGRKRREAGGGPELLLLLCVLLRGANCYGEVGCLFSKNLCKPVAESCYNDLAFGRCIRIEDDTSEKDLYQYNLEPEELELLRMQLERLEYEGYKWPHDYTQCVMQILLEDLRYRLNNDAELLCKNSKLRPEDVFDEVDNQVVVDKDGGIGDAQDPVAIVKFTPSRLNPHGEFADEFYYPSDMRARMAEERRKAAALGGFDDYGEGFYDKLPDIPNPEEVYRRGSRSLSKKSLGPSPPAVPYLKENYAIPREYVEALRGFLENEANLYNAEDDEGLEFLPEVEEENRKPIDEVLEDYEKTFSRKYKYPKDLEAAEENREESIEDDYEDGDELEEGEAESARFGNANPIPKPIIDSLAQQTSGGMYTEGGTILPMRRDVIRPARRHAKSRAKLAGLRTPDPEASKDYQELCRARMAAKQSDKLSESPKGFDFGRLLESGKSESNRSSTSSWSEEPQVTNMDISTGHVVLSYMEDHLKNQEKLDEEWAALCAYEAEPCSTAVAEAEGNAECNRPGAALPYDHSRVILNDLANLNNSDYINASTITDHDPRNPAYIATQGPLPQTAADFWQLVWEQGSVVIVMLTRLTEEGQAMCHRYWPDEGSELYHIYEVHLVSEHIWCDDYLVRSFYLKNLRTGETRTVTQFHFLSWPQNGVPKSSKTLLEFRRKVNKSYRGRSCPIIVHCSDGAGRTGTYCLIDMVLNRMAKGAKEIDIAATLEHIRDQRADMVATKQQYEFVLMAVAEEVHAILKSLPIVAEKPSDGEKPSSSSSTTTQQQTPSRSTKSDK